MTIDKCYSIELNAIALSMFNNNEFFTNLGNEFNLFAKDNNINATLSFTLYSSFNSSNINVDYENTIEFLLHKGSDKYDIFLFDSIYTPNLSYYFLDLNKWISEDHLKMYSSGVASKTCVHNGKWVGLPLNINYSLLYSNGDLLKKYGMPIPKTWDELIDIGKFIYIKEKEAGNEDLIGYNGLIPETEGSFQTVQEFIYSFRDKISSPYPEYNSKEALEALITLKKIKEELSSDDIFKSKEDYSISRLISGNAIFLKFWTYRQVNPVYNISLVPGHKEGVSGTFIEGNIIGINKQITDNRKKLAVEALTYMTSRKIQKQITMKSKIISGIDSLYDDEEVCEVIQCDVIKNIQYVTRPSTSSLSYDTYSSQFRKYIFDFMYGDESAQRTLLNIENIIKMTHISLSTEESIVGFIVFIVTIIMSVIMLLSLIFLFIEKYKPFFTFLSVDFWFILVAGTIIGLFSIFTLYGVMDEQKCHFNYLLISIGFSLRLIPILHKLISNFPKKSKLILIITNHRYPFLFLFIVFDISAYTIIYFLKYQIVDVIIPYALNYKKCVMTGPVQFILYLASFLEKIVVILMISILLFLEWNLAETKKDTKTVCYALSLDSIMFLIIMGFGSVNFNEYYEYFIIISVLNMLLSISNYVCLYIIRLFWITKMDENSDLRDIESALNKFNINEEDFLKSDNNNNNNNNNNNVTQTVKSDIKRNSIISSMLSYHFYSGVEKDSHNTLEISSKLLPQQNKDILNNVSIDSSMVPNSNNTSQRNIIHRNSNLNNINQRIIINKNNNNNSATNNNNYNNN